MNTLIVEITPPIPPHITLIDPNQLLIELGAFVVPTIEVNPIVLPNIEIISGHNVVVTYNVLEHVQVLPVDNIGQTIFTLSRPSTTPNNSLLMVQPSSISLSYGSDYIISGNILTILLSDIILETSESLLIYYY